MADKMSLREFKRVYRKGDIELPLEIGGVGVLVDYEWFFEIVNKVMQPLVEKEGLFIEEVRRIPINDDGSDRGSGIGDLVKGLPNTQIGV